MKKSNATVLVLASIVGGISLLVMAVRPCEPKAQAAETPAFTATMGPITVKPGTFTMPVEALPKAPVALRKPLAHIARKHGECTARTPGVVVSEQELIQGSGGMVQVYDCQ